MESWIASISNKSFEYILFFIFLISFLESFPLFGLIMPGLFLMSIIGTIVIKQKINFFYACTFSTLGCLLGDWIAYYLGKKFKNFLKKKIFLKNKFKIFKITKKYLIKYSIMTILLGKLIGFTRPIIPILSGILKVPFLNFFFPNLVGCIIWPYIYLSPGIFIDLIFKKIKILNNINIINIQEILFFITLFFLFLYLYKTIKKKYFNFFKKK